MTCAEALEEARRRWPGFQVWASEVRSIQPDGNEYISVEIHAAGRDDLRASAWTFERGAEAPWAQALTPDECRRSAELRRVTGSPEAFHAETDS